LSLETVSTGGTAALELLENSTLPEGINQVRVGEGLLLGRNPVRNKALGWLKQDAFKLKAEIVEIKTKPSLPLGEMGFDAFGKVPEFEDRGTRKRAVLAIGRQDVDTDGLMPVAAGIEILGGSSDQVVADVTDSSCTVTVGDVLEFALNYSSLLRAMTSPFVRKRYVSR
jgi:predicted amino acid racemase